ncbi:MAG: FAD-dependent thymidylate synthase [Desulfobulbaceae bacterium]|uniref:FAD-dependent thymidylate synthase n=1 Tax=Candidatus Desulfatifera sulfidica TaxID=2841691 RepID=A0A8J6TDY9_9BACT|nr:FAD-dependent thymidylate synthase [Candidatus Desulfatifera sulfidica]
MQIVEPSFEIQDDLDQASLVIRLEACGRICYKSEEKISRDSALPFVTKIAEYGHNSVLEMAAVTLRVTGCSEEQIAELLACEPRYIFIDRVADALLVTGSIRSFRELSQRVGHTALVRAMVDFQAGSHPYLFEGVWSGPSPELTAGIAVKKLPLAEVELLEPELLARHRFLGVKFIINRAVTHELVRHRPCSFLQESQRYCRYSQDKFGNQVTFVKPMFYAEDSPEYGLWREAMERTEQLYLQLLETSTPQAARTVLPNSCKTEIIVYCNLAEWSHIFRLRCSPAAEPSMREIMIPLAAKVKERYPQLD